MIKFLKVIIETCYLTDSEKVALCKCITNGGADYIKTSTGFGSGGAEALKILDSLKAYWSLMYRLRPQVVFALLRI